MVHRTTILVRSKSSLRRGVVPQPVLHGEEKGRGDLNEVQNLYARQSAEDFFEDAPQSWSCRHHGSGTLVEQSRPWSPSGIHVLQPMMTNRTKPNRLGIQTWHGSCTQNAASPGTGGQAMGFKRAVRRHAEAKARKLQDHAITNYLEFS